MSEENSNSTAPEALNTAGTKKLSEDARGLGPKPLGPFVMGLVDMVAGDGGVEVPAFVATKNEIVQLVRYWATVIVRSDFEFFVYGCTGSSEWRTREFADRRLTTITKLIGEEKVTQAFKEAEEAFAKGVDHRAWKIFMEGTKEQQEEFQQEVQEELARDLSEGESMHQASRYQPNPNQSS